MPATNTEPAYTVYGHPTCPMVLPVRTILRGAGVEHAYINIHADDSARQLVREINGGHEGVPVIRFPDGSTVTEPRIGELRARLQAFGVSVSPLLVVAGHLLNYRFVILPLGLIGLLILFETVV